MDSIYRGWRFIQDRVLGYTAGLVMLGVTILANVEIFRRYVEGRTFYWGQDAVTYFMIGAAFIYFGVTQARRAHLAVTALPDWLQRSGRVRLAMGIRAVISFISILFTSAFIYWGWPGAERTRELGRMTESMIIPLWPFQYVLLIGMGMMTITLLFQLYREVMAVLGKNVFSWDTDHDQFEI